MNKLIGHGSFGESTVVPDMKATGFSEVPRATDGAQVKMKFDVLVTEREAVPVVGSVPDQSPDAVQPELFDTAQLRITLPPIAGRLTGEASMNPVAAY